MIQNSRGEWMVFVPSTHSIFQRFDDDRSTPCPKVEVRSWLRHGIGKQTNTILDDVSEDRPWRHRVWQVNTTHAFFFHTRRQALLFMVRWLYNDYP